jgi:hypothetical protein
LRRRWSVYEVVRFVSLFVFRNNFSGQPLGFLIKISKFLSKKAALFFSLGENDEIQKRKKQPRNNSE